MGSSCWSSAQTLWQLTVQLFEFPWGINCLKPLLHFQLAAEIVKGSDSFEGSIDHIWTCTHHRGKGPLLAVVDSHVHLRYTWLAGLDHAAVHEGCASHDKGQVIFALRTGRSS
jgi:hypothetical protein